MDRLWKVMDEDAASSKPSRAEAFSAYSYAVLLIGLGVIASLALQHLLGDGVVFLLFVPSLLVASARGGLWPGLAATVLGVVAGSILVLSADRFVLGNVVNEMLFAGLGVAVAIGGERLREGRRRADAMAQQIGEREAYLQSILSTVPDAMVVIDEHGIVQSFSAAAEKLFGWSVSEVAGQNVSILMPSPYREAHDGYLRHYAMTGERRMIGLRRMELAQRKDGSTFVMELSVGEMAWGGHRYFTGFVKDLTDRQESERRVQFLQSELAHVSRFSAMGEMAAALAHELNQPLSAISNYLRGAQRLLDAQNPGSEAIGAIGRAAEQALRAGQIIRRLRNFVSREETEKRVESLARLLDEVFALALIGAKERGVQVHIDRDPAADVVLVDKVQIQQVVFNLVRNALEAMDGCDRRELVIRVVRAPCDMAEVSIEDTGSGIDPDIMERLFQPLVTTKGSQGMGVGLSICRTIVEAHGGRIWPGTNPRGGATFSFTVPLAREDEVA